MDVQAAGHAVADVLDLAAGCPLRSLLAHVSENAADVHKDRSGFHPAQTVTSTRTSAPAGA
jgi:hypothetical protein